MPDEFRSRVMCTDIIRGIVAIDPWFASYALEQFIQAADLRVLNDITEGLESIVERPQLAANERLERLLAERFS